MKEPIKDTSLRTHQKSDETFKREAVAEWQAYGIPFPHANDPGITMGLWF